MPFTVPLWQSLGGNWRSLGKDSLEGRYTQKEWHTAKKLFSLHPLPFLHDCHTLEKLWQFFNIASRTDATSSHHTWHGIGQCCTCRIPYVFIHCKVTIQEQMHYADSKESIIVYCNQCKLFTTLGTHVLLLGCVLRVDEELLQFSFYFCFIFVRKTHCKLSDLCIMTLWTVSISNCMYWLVWAILTFIYNRFVFTSDISVTCRVNQDSQEHLDCLGQQVQR